MPLGVPASRHLKLGPGGLSDVEWTVQFLQLQHAGTCPRLRTQGTLAALAAEQEAGLIGKDDAKVLREAWILATAVRNAGYLWSPSNTRADILPESSQDLSGLAACMPSSLGHGARWGQELANDVLASMRRARRVMSRLFYGYDE